MTGRAQAQNMTPVIYLYSHFLLDEIQTLGRMAQIVNTIVKNDMILEELMSALLKEKALKKTVRKASFVAWFLAFVSLASWIGLWLLDYSKNLYWFAPGLLAGFGLMLFVLGWLLFRRQRTISYRWNSLLDLIE